MTPPDVHRQPFGNVENILWSNNNVAAAEKDDLNKKHIGRTDVRSLVRKFAPSKLDTTNYHRHPSGVNSSITSAEVFPQSHYRVTIYNNNSSTSFSSPPQIPTKTPRPNDDFLASFNSVLTKNYPDGTGYLDLRGAIQEGDPEWNEDLDLDEIKFTDTQVKRIKVLITPKERCKSMDDMGRLLLGNQFDRRHKSFGVGYSHHVLRAFDMFRKRYAKISENKIRFNILFGFTYHLYRNDWWMTHHGRGWGGEKMVVRLSKLWKQLLQTEARHLGLDDEFSVPAVEHFLDEFKRKVEEVETYGDPPMKFLYC